MANSNTTSNDNKITWSELLTQAVKAPGKMLEAYRAFHNYSFGNILLAMAQCEERQMPIGPLATFDGWKKKNRYVRKGEKAITLCRPAIFKVKNAVKETKPVVLNKFANHREGQMQLPLFDTPGAETGERVIKRFVYENRWFVMSQTDGAGYQLPEIDWDKETALKALGVAEIPFEHYSGNAQGYAAKNKFAINPLAQLPAKTMIHELAHIVLGHTQAETYKSHEGESLPLNLMEVEAESTAMLCIASLGLPGVEYCRGYIQSWLKKERINDQTAQRIMGAADKILKAGVKADAKAEAA